MTNKPRYCAVCKAVIEPERMEGNPTTRLCMRHHEEIKKYGGEFTSTSHRGSLGKAGSLKRNYGDVTVTRQRNEKGLNRLMDDYDREQWEKKEKQQS